MQVFKFTIPLIIIFIIAVSVSNSHANCEAGAYIVHTIAEYPDSDDSYRFFEFETGGDHSGSFALKGRDQGEKSIPDIHQILITKDDTPRFRLIHGKDQCTLDVNPGHVIYKPTEEPFEEFLLQFQPCFKNIDLIPKRGYTRLDLGTRTVQIPDELPINIEEPSVPHKKAIRNHIMDNLTKLNLNMDSYSEATIKWADVRKVEFEYTLIGKRNGGFMVGIAVLHLKNLDRLLPEYAFPKKSIRGRMAMFPVIIFKRGNEKPYYFGDGSWCAAYRLWSKVEKNLENLGPVERFKVTGAWDLDHDGIADIIEINDELAYYLSRNGRWLVVRDSPGC